MLQFIPTWTYSQTTYYYTVRIKVDDKTIYSERSTLSDHSIRTMTVNLGKRNRVTVTFEAEW
jgi:predicted FMN-binding regulatory protein PaiB